MNWDNFTNIPIPEGATSITVYAGPDGKFIGKLNNKGENMLDLTKPVQTRGGREARVLMEDGGGNMPLIGVMRQLNGTWCETRWTREGKWNSHNSPHLYDLVNVPQKFSFTQWVNVYADGPSKILYNSRDAADNHAIGNRIACIRVVIEGEEGQLDKEK